MLMSLIYTQLRLTTLLKGWSHIHEFHGELLRVGILVHATNFNNDE